MIGYERDTLREGPLLRPMDAPGLATIIFFIAASILVPDTGSFRAGSWILPRGYAVAAGFSAALILVLGLAAAERRYGGRVLCFLRTLYPLLLITPFFLESILLSARVFGGRSHDAFFRALDEAIFGFEPYLEFYKSFESFPRFNELMFGSYFIYYVMIATVLWIPWIKGDREETERAVFVYFMIQLTVAVWYVFFRVQGPKYWVPELRNHWYGSFAGFLFVPFFQRGFETVTLSGAAFPSSHVLFSTLCVLFAWRWDKRFLAFYLPMLALVLLATVYIFAHYAVDGFAALVLAPLLYLGYSRLYDPFRSFLGFRPLPNRSGRRTVPDAARGA